LCSGTVKYERSLGQTIDADGVTYFNLTVDAGTMVASEDLVVNNILTIAGGTLNMNNFDLTLGNAPSLGNFVMTAATPTPVFIPGASDGHTVLGSWDCSGGTFQATAGTITFSGGTQTIKTNTNNKFNNLTIDGTIATLGDNDIEIGGVLLVNATKELTVTAGDQLTFTGNSSDHIINGTLTMNTSPGINSTIDFTGASTNTIVVNGTLNLNGTDATSRALVTGALANTVNLSILEGGGTGDGLFIGNFFTISFPHADGVKIDGTTEPTMANGIFQNPATSGTLLNLKGAESLPPSLANLTFNGTPGVHTNVSADTDTDPVTFIDFDGTLASTSTVAEANDEDVGDPGIKLLWFDGTWYSEDLMILAILINGGLILTVMHLV